MRTMFIQGGSRWKIDTEGGIHTDANLSARLWDRYRKYSNEFTVVLRVDDIVYDRSQALEAFNAFDDTEMGCMRLTDLYRPICNFVSPLLRKQVADDISEAVAAADRIIIREPGNFYTDTALKCAIKQGKRYLIEVTSDIREVLSDHGSLGKVLAPIEGSRSARYIQNAPYVLYVTESYLQDRYPTKGRQIGCSDVDLEPLSKDEAATKIENSGIDKSILNIGTAAGLDVDLKRQGDVIRAIAILKGIGNTSFRYHLLGNGTGEKLVKLARELDVEDAVTIDGSLPHEKVPGWLDALDLYVQPSYSEGLSRSIAEAMSRACPVICSNVGGNYELVPKENMFEACNPERIALLLQKMANHEERQKSARISYAASLRYTQELLDSKRDAFLAEFFER